MKLRDAAQLAWVNIFQTPMRSILTVLGLAIGIGAILTVMTLGNAGQSQVEIEIARLGVDKVWITAKHQSNLPLTREYGETAAKAANTIGSAKAYTMSLAVLDGQSAYVQVTGCDDQMPKVQQLNLLAGRFFSKRDDTAAASVAVLDEGLCRALWGNGAAADVVDKRIALGGQLYQVIGIIGDISVETFGQSEGTIYLPLSTYQDRFGGNVSEVTLSVPANANAQDVAQSALDALPKGGSFEAITLQEEIEAARSVVRIFMMVLVCVAIVCMLVGGIGVMNILLVSVRERRREIGVMKALGSTGGQICTMFLLESGAYALLGGAFGILVGGILVHVCAGWIGLNASLQWDLIPAAVGIATAAGLFFGVAPASRAARLEPVEALRQI